MATITLTLKHGLKIGETVHTEAELREPSVGDMIDAVAESERVVMVEDIPGQAPRPALLASPVLVSINSIARQIVRVGTHPGPFTLAEMRRLHPDDLKLLQAHAALLESAALEVGRAGEP